LVCDACNTSPSLNKYPLLQNHITPKKFLNKIFSRVWFIYIITMSDEFFGRVDESRKLKRKIEEASSAEVVDSELLLSMSLGNNNMVGESSSICKTLKNPMDHQKQWKTLIIR